ncbi:MAG: hypothetical protein LBL02_02550 [Endomicrobium sp.]|nr:hypothetical protein [Endomicrobium sp.]
MSAIAIDALEKSKNFVQRAISNEVQDENCEITRVVDTVSANTMKRYTMLFQLI